jgi:hypothetical protein
MRRRAQVPDYGWLEVMRISAPVDSLWSEGRSYGWWLQDRRTERRMAKEQ